jgi:HlyD family secretion protein
MSRNKKIVIGVLVVLVLGAFVAANFAFKRNPGTEVTSEKIAKRDLEAIVSASGTIQPKRSVNISAETPGKIVNLSVNEGDPVKKGQPLLEIDPRSLQTAVDNHEASLATQRSTLDQTKTQVDNAEISVRQAKDALARQEGMWQAKLISKQDWDKANDDVKIAETNLSVAKQAVLVQQTRIKQEEANLDSAKYDLSKVSIASPIDGLVTKRNVEEGETAVMGTMNNAGTVLLTIADMSVIQAEIQVDETDIPYVKVGELAKITIDAIPNKTFPGKVTEVGNSPIDSGTAAASSSQRATNFKVVVTLDSTLPNVRPGFTCTSVITTATRTQVTSVPIQAMTVREMVVDNEGQIVREPAPKPGQATRLNAQPAELKPGQQRKEIEGVFMIKEGKALFQPVDTGIAGEKYFEVLTGLKDGDEVITGPFASVRGLKDGDPVKLSTLPAPATTSKD